ANADTAFALRRQGRTIVRESIDSTDWSYQLAGGLEFQLSRPIWLQLGWRYMKYDFKKNGFTDTNALSGPFVQLGVNFWNAALVVPGIESIFVMKSSPVNEGVRCTKY